MNDVVARYKLETAGRESTLNTYRMAKAILTVIKIQARGGAATPAPPLGPALSQHGVNIAQFVNDFNNATQEKRGEVVPAHQHARRPQRSKRIGERAGIKITSGF